MNESGRILIADDEETFLNSTADLLRREGYECDCAFDAKTVIERLKENRYDLMIADIHMPGNLDLELIKELQRVEEGMPVVLVTGYPSVKTATQAIQLPVEAYMVKPIEFDELLTYVKNSIVRFRAYCVICSTRNRLKDWRKELDDIEKLVSNTSGGTSSISINNFFVLTLRNIVDSLLDLKHLMEELAMNSDEQYICNLLECPRLSKLKDGLTESIGILNKTKSAFKSKDLGDLRKKLEVLVEKM